MERATDEDDWQPTGVGSWEKTSGLSGPVDVELTLDPLRYGGCPILQTDLRTENGYIHVIGGSRPHRQGSRGRRLTPVERLLEALLAGEGGLGDDRFDGALVGERDREGDAVARLSRGTADLRRLASG